jgi:hypothetical protein
VARTSNLSDCPSSITLGVLAILVAANVDRARPVIAQSDLAATEPAAAPSEKPHPLDPALELARDCWQHSQAQVRDYTAILTKRCRVGGELTEHQYAYVKIRNRRAEHDRVTTPMSVYLRFLKPDSIKGREVIWVEGRNQGRLVAHDGGLKGIIRVNLDPRGSLAMRGQRYPITEVGMDNLLLKLIERGNRDRGHGECQVEFYQDSKVDGRRCRMIQIIHPVQRPHFDFHRAQVFFDDELKLPVRYASWSWPAESGGQPPLEEEYTYTRIKINVGLTELDFDPDNSEYDF